MTVTSQVSPDIVETSVAPSARGLFPELLHSLVLIGASFALVSLYAWAVSRILAQYPNHTGVGFGALYASVLFAFFVYAMAANALGRRWYNRRKLKAAKDWPTAEAAVEYSKVHVDRYSEGYAVEAAVIYSFEVNGKKYRGDRIRFGRQQAVEFPSEQAAAAELAALPVGKKVLVSYNPKDPGDSVIHPPSIFTHGAVPRWLNWIVLSLPVWLPLGVYLASLFRHAM